MRAMLHVISAVFFIGGAYWFVTGLNIVLGARGKAADDGMAALGTLVGYQAASTPLIVGALLIVGAALMQALLHVAVVLDDVAKASRAAAFARAKEG